MSEKTKEQTHGGASDARWVALYSLALLLLIAWLIGPV